MATVLPGQTIRSREPTLSVDPLDPGLWRFQLIVVDDQRRASAPAELTVEVQAPPDLDAGDPRR